MKNCERQFNALSFVFLLGGIMSLVISNAVSALSFQDRVDVNFTFNPSISLSVSGDLIIDNLAPGSSSDSNIIDVTVTSNNMTGYVLTATAGNTSHADTDLTQSGVTNKFTSVATNASLASLTADDTWGYSFSSDTGTTWSNYSGLPLYTASGAELASINTNATTPIKFKIAAKASNTQVSGTYTNVINFIAVANPEPHLEPVACTAGKICYQPNSLTTVEGTMGQQSATDDNTITLLASNYSKSGYGFAGWSDAYDYATNPNAHFYGPQETITAPTGTTANGLSLYAVWIQSAGSMQNTAKVSELCGTGQGALTTAPTDGTANLSSVSALTDSRDGQTYAIAKLADGKCWMIENLRLDNTAILILANTNNPLNDGVNVTLKHNYADTDTYNTLSPSSNKIYNAETAPEGWCQTNSAECFDQSRLYTDNISNRSSTPTSNNSNLYSYGNYYNWYSATAGKGTSSFNSQSTNGDICPLGWHLPKGGSKNNYNEFWALVVTEINNGVNPASYDSAMPSYSGADEAGPINAVLRGYPYNFLYTGYVDGNLLNRGSFGDYWTSTSGTSPRAYYFSHSPTKVNPAADPIYRASRYDGRAVRCIATQP